MTQSKWFQTIGWTTCSLALRTRNRIRFPGGMTIEGIKIIFFDIGNVFVSDDPSACYAYERLFDRLHQAGKFHTPEEFFAERLEHIKQGGNLWSFVGQFVPPNEFAQFQQDVRRQMYEQWGGLSPAIPAMEEAVKILAPHYRLGLIANQPRQVRDVLQDRGLFDLFEVHGISEEVGLEKPNPEFFRWALKKANVEAREAMMIGDRADNDVKPAKGLGMHTLWLKLGREGRGWVPQTHFERCYAMGTESFYFSDRAPRGPEEEPEFIALSARHLVELLVDRTAAERIGGSAVP